MWPHQDVAFLLFDICINLFKHIVLSRYISKNYLPFQKKCIWSLYLKQKLKMSGHSLQCVIDPNNTKPLHVYTCSLNCSDTNYSGPYTYTLYGPKLRVPTCTLARILCSNKNTSKHRNSHRLPALYLSITCASGTWLYGIIHIILLIKQCKSYAKGLATIWGQLWTCWTKRRLCMYVHTPLFL